MKWVEVNKGTDEAPDIRCRLVARDFKPKSEKDREDLFAAMPPLEAKRLLFRLTRCLGNEFKMLFLDVRKAHLNGVCDVDAYVELPVEAKAEKVKIGKLKRWHLRDEASGSCLGKRLHRQLREGGLGTWQSVSGGISQ